MSGDRRDFVKNFGKLIGGHGSMNRCMNHLIMINPIVRDIQALALRSKQFADCELNWDGRSSPEPWDLYDEFYNDCRRLVLRDCECDSVHMLIQNWGRRARGEPDAHGWGPCARPGGRDGFHANM